MFRFSGLPRRQAHFLVGCTLLALGAVTVNGVGGQQKPVDTLRIGASGQLTAHSAASKEEAALETLRVFIKDETGLNNEIVREKDWQTLADKMAKGELHIGVFQGYEFAWARERQANLHPLALAINVYRYPVVYVVAKKDSPARDFAGLKGQSLAVPALGQPYLTLFLERQSLANGLKPEAFFAKITHPENVEDALDDVVDGVVQTAVTDRAGLDAFKRRKPGRFAKLKEVVHSQPLPPVVVAYYDKVLDESTLARFRKGMLEASHKEKGETMLTLFRLTGFETPPSDFDRVLAETRKAYPPPDGKK